MKITTSLKVGSAAFVVVIGAALFAFNAPEPPKPEVKPWTPPVVVTPPVEQITIDGLLVGTNRLRPTPLTLDPELNASASAKCADMSAKNYWSHNAPDGTEPWVFFPAYDWAGENLAENYRTNNEVIAAWRFSTTHYENIIAPRFNRVGFGICDFRAGQLVVQHFRD